MPDEIRAREQQPSGHGWRRLPPPKGGSVDGTIAESFWTDGRLSVCSSLILAELPTGRGIGPQWHVSVSRFGKRPKPGELRRAQKTTTTPATRAISFAPSILPSGLDCECKTNETLHTEPDGFATLQRRLTRALGTLQAIAGGVASVQRQIRCLIGEPGLTLTVEDCAEIWGEGSEQHREAIEDGGLRLVATDPSTWKGDR